MGKEKETAIVPVEKYAVMKKTPEEVGTIVRMNAGTLGITRTSFERVSLPAGGGKRFEVATLEGDKDFETLQGVVLAFRDVRVYWEQAYDEGGGGGSPPDCQSKDCLTGQGSPGGDCSICPFAQFGSDGRGQKCGQYRTLLLMQPDEIVPIFVNLPPTSVGNCQKFFMKMSSKGMMYCDAVLQLGLNVKPNADGIKYSEIVLKVMSELPEEQKGRFRSLAQTFDNLLGGMSDVAIAQPGSVLNEVPES